MSTEVDSRKMLYVRSPRFSETLLSVQVTIGRNSHRNWFTRLLARPAAQLSCDVIQIIFYSIDSFAVRD